MANIAVFCSGFGSNFQAIIDSVRQKKLRANIALMVCDNPKAYAIVRARKNNIPFVVLSPQLFSTRLEHEKIIVRILKSQKIDLIALAGYMRLLTPYFIHAYRRKIINIHPSLLPAFKGAHAIQDAFEAGVSVTGVSVHIVTEKMDAGPVLGQEKVKILPSDTIQSLEKRIHQVEHQLYPRAIRNYLRIL